MKAVKGHSVVLLLHGVSISNHFLVYYMHEVCLGTMKRLVDTWLSSKKTEPYHTGHKVLEINERLAWTAPPPSAMRHFPKDIAQYKSTYKGEYFKVAYSFVLKVRIDEILGILNKKQKTTRVLGLRACYIHRIYSVGRLWWA